MQGVNVKTRKRNVAVPLDPAGFAEKVITVINTGCKEAEAETIDAKLAAAGKAVDAADLDFSRYGDTLFEIYFAGARMGIGAKLADDTKETIDFYVRSCVCTPHGAPSPACPAHSWPTSHLHLDLKCDLQEPWFRVASISSCLAVNSQ